MKSRKHIAQERDFGFVPDTFKLFGEVVREDDAPKLHEDSTPELFVDRAAVERGRRELHRDTNLSPDNEDALELLRELGRQQPIKVTQP